VRAAVASLVALAACGGSPPAPAPLPPLASSSAPAGAPAPAAPAPAPDITSTVDGDVTDAWVHGIHVLVKRDPSAETASTALYVLGGAMTWTKQTAGLEELALAVAASGGTAHLDKDAFDKRLADLGASITTEATHGYSELAAWSLLPAWDDTFQLLAQVFREPALPATQLEIERRQQIAEIQHELADPDARLALLVDAGMFKDHPYAIRPEGTLETVGGFTAAQVAARLQSLRQTSRMLIVVVGNLDAQHVLTAVQRAFGDLPKGDYAATPVPDVPSVATGNVEVSADKLPTNYIEAAVVGPRWTDPDFAVARVAMEWLGQLEFEEVRTKRNLSYAPNAALAWRSTTPLAFLYVTAVDPRTTMKVMLDQARRMRDAPISEHDLAAAKAMLLTNTYMAAEAPADQGTQLAQAQIFGGDWHVVRTIPERVRAVTAAQVQAWCAKHLTHFRTFVIGDGAKLDRAALESF
jgi:predicted Zn-dependent peptidase